MSAYCYLWLLTGQIKLTSLIIKTLKISLIYWTNRWTKTVPGFFFQKYGNFKLSRSTSCQVRRLFETVYNLRGNFIGGKVGMGQLQKVWGKIFQRWNKWSQMCIPSRKETLLLSWLFIFSTGPFIVIQPSQKSLLKNEHFLIYVSGQPSEAKNEILIMMIWKI